MDRKFLKNVVQIILYVLAGLFLFAFIGYLINLTKKPQNTMEDSIAKHAEPIKLHNWIPYIFSPEGCRFKVAFKETPEISKSIPVNNNGIIGDTYAQLLSEEDTSVMKAEFILTNYGTERISDAKRIEMIKGYINGNGIQNAVIDYKENGAMKHYEIRGNKDVKDENRNTVSITYTAQYYFYKDNMFIVYAGSPSTLYPTIPIVDFYNSVSLTSQ